MNPPNDQSIFFFFLNILIKVDKIKLAITLEFLIVEKYVAVAISVAELNWVRINPLMGLEHIFYYPSHLTYIATIQGQQLVCESLVLILYETHCNQLSLYL